MSAFSHDDEDIYQEHVLDHYEDPYHRGHLQRPTHADDGRNPLCGDKVHVELRMDSQGVVQEAWFEGEGCCISQASASMLMEAMEGKTADQVRNFTAEQMLELFGARLTPNRQKCCLLPWRVIQSALHSPIEDGPEDQDDDGLTFSGPHLGEES